MEDSLNSILSQQIKTNKFSHAYIFEGLDPKLVEYNYLTLVRSALIKDKHTEKKFLEGNLPDLYIIEAEKNNITIDQIRDISKRIFEKPLESDYKIFIIKEAEKMRKEAQNALLKTLEDAPIYGIIILVTDNKYKLLDTIISRCQIINIQGDLSDNLSNDIKEKIDGIILSAYHKEIHKIIQFKEVTADKGLDKKSFLLYLEDFLISILKYKKGIYSHIGDSDKLIELSNLSSPLLEKLIIEIDKIRQLLYVNINFQLAVENLLFMIVEEGK